MEENVALDSSKQKKFVKSIKGIKKLIKKAEESEVPENVEPKVQKEKKSKRKRPERGLVYLSHIPHGFYEHEMTQYFKQFGAVSNVRVIRSKRTGNSKGFAFVEFKQPAVAEIVAETMNNYLMGKRLIKAAYVPPEKQKPKAMRKHWNRLNNPGRTERLKHKKGYNETKDHAGEIARARKTLAVYKKNMKKLSNLGINYDFFTPVDIPEELLESNESQNTVESTSKKNKDTVQKDSKKKDKVTETKTVSKKDKVKEVKVKEQKKELKKENKVPEPVVNKKEQKQKQQKLKDAGVKPPENFIKVQDDESDSSADFDSDDYNKAMENDSDVESGDDSDESGDEGSDQEDDEPGSEDEFEITGSDDDDSEVDESEEEQVVPPKKGKSKLGPIAPPAPIPANKLAKQLLKATQEVLSKSSKQKRQKAKPEEKVSQQKGPKAPELGKRKAQQKSAGSPKKPKFEKQTQQPMKKKFKNKK